MERNASDDRFDQKRRWAAPTRPHLDIVAHQKPPGKPRGFLSISFTKLDLDGMGSFLKIRLACSYKKRIDAAVKENGWTWASYSTPY